MHIFRSSTKIGNFIETTNSFPHIYHPKQIMYISQNSICRQKVTDTTLNKNVKTQFRVRVVLMWR